MYSRGLSKQLVARLEDKLNCVPKTKTRALRVIDLEINFNFSQNLFPTRVSGWHNYSKKWFKCKRSICFENRTCFVMLFIFLYWILLINLWKNFSVLITFIFNFLVFFKNLLIFSKYYDAFEWMEKKANKQTNSLSLIYDIVEIYINNKPSSSLF